MQHFLKEKRERKKKEKNIACEISRHSKYMATYCPTEFLKSFFFLKVLKFIR